ncbi:MAG TPA: hypothetical protein VFD70_05685 [Anaerolineae bacterium]|nr:hypothetical protein [Anaerolineae bacterium]
MALADNATPPQPTKQVSLATKIYDEEWSLVNFMRFTRSQLAKGEAAVIQVIIREDTKDLQILLSEQALKHIVFVAVS